jgi:hypothetical protein
MKPIQIKSKLKPFSTTPGVEIPLVQAGLTLKIYPTFIEVFKEGISKRQLTLQFPELTESFVASLDLYKGWIEVQLQFKKSTLHYLLLLENNELVLDLRRTPKNSISYTFEDKSFGSLSKNERLVLIRIQEVFSPSPLELLSLGGHKKQHLESMKERRDFIELAPHLFLMGQYAKKSHLELNQGNFVYLKSAYDQRDKKNHHLILSELEPLLNTGFSSFFVPHVEDPFHWGYSTPKVHLDRPSPFSLLRELYLLFRSFFIQSEDKALYLLPHLPPLFHCGRLIHVQQGGLHLDIEWSKKMIKKVYIRSNKEQTLKLHFQNPIQECRIRLENKPTQFKNKSSFTFEKFKTYIIDRFEK